MANQQLGEQITDAVSECEDTVGQVAQTLGEVLGMWIAEAARATGATPDQIRAVVDASVDRAIGEVTADVH